MKLFKQLFLILFIATLFLIVGCKNDTENKGDDEHIHNYIDGACSCGDTIEVIYTVTFIDYNGVILKEQKIKKGESAIAPNNPSREGYTFTGWSEDYSKIESNLTIIALYSKNEVELNYHKHEYQSRVIAASCCNPEYELYSCIHCSDEYIEIKGNKLEHQFYNEICTTCGSIRDLSGLIYLFDSNTNEYKVVGYEGKTDVEIPASYNNYPVTIIGDFAFDNCELSSVVLPKSIKEVGYDAFDAQFNEIWYPDVETGEMKQLPFIVKFEGNLSDWCSIDFKNKDSNPIGIGRSYTEFYILNNNEYEIIKDLYIPNDIDVIKQFSFYNLNINNLVMHDNVTNIGKYAFCNAYINQCKFSNNLISIDECAFLECRNLKNLNLPDSLRIINYASFRECYHIESIYFGTNITIIDQDAFCYINNLKTINLNENNSNYSLIKGNLYSKDGESLVLVASNDYTIYLSKNITSISKRAFNNCKINTVYFDGNLEEWLQLPLKAEIFKIEYPFIYDDIHLYIMDDVQNYIELTDVTIPNSVLEIGYHFYGVQSLRSIKIPESVTKIADSAFRHCINLENVEFTKSIESIGEAAFENCDNLKNFYFNGTIEDWCKIKFYSQGANPMSKAENVYFKNEFGEYYLVTEVIIPSSVNSIGDYQFYGKHDLTIIIPKHVIYVGFYAVSGKVYCEAESKPDGWNIYWGYADKWGYQN